MKSLLPLLPFLDLSMFSTSKGERQLTETDIYDIMEYKQDGKSTSWIAKRMCLNQVTVARVIRKAKHLEKKT